MRPTLASILALLAMGAAASGPAGAQGSADENRIVTFQNGDVFSGKMRDGVPNGPGTYTVGGKTYSGNWKDGCLATRDGHRFAIGTTLDKCPPWRKPGFSRPDFR